MLIQSTDFCQNDNDYSFKDSKSIKLLDASIPRKEGKIYLWADYKKIRDNRIPIYIINNTDSVIKYDGYQLAEIQQEFQNSSSNWQRSTYLFFSWCGTPYVYNIKIFPREFYTSSEPFLSGKRKYKVRYTSFSSKIESSNIVWGNIDISEVEIAKYDDISFNYCDVDYLIKVIKEMPRPYKVIPKSYTFIEKYPKYARALFESLNKNIIYNAIRKLGDRFPIKALEILEPIASNMNHPYNDAASWEIKVIKNRKK